MRTARACETSVWLTLATGLPAFLSSTTRVGAFYNERVIDSHVLGNAAILPATASRYRGYCRYFGLRWLEAAQTPDED